MKITLALLMLAAPLFAEDPIINLPPFFQHRKIDSDFRSPGKPDPSLALAHGVFLPGAGWFYLSDYSPTAKPVYIGLAYAAGTLGLAGLLWSSADRRNAAVMVPVSAGLIVLRWSDVSGATKAAIKMRGKD